MEDWRDAIWAAVAPDAVPERLEERLDFLLAHVQTGDRVLDLGSGDGTFAAALVTAGADVVAADVAAEAVRRTAERAPSATVAHLDEGAALPFGEDAFDLGWLGETLEHVADVTGLVAELRRVVRWGGTLLVTTPNVPRLGIAWEALRGRPLEERLDPRADHLRFFTARTLGDVLHDGGFTDVSIRAVGGPPLLRSSLTAVAR